MTRAHAKLLGPCFKTGRTDDQLLHRGWGFESSTRTELTAGTCRMRPPPTASSAPNRARNHSPHRSGQTTLPRLWYQTPKGWPQNRAHAAAPTASAHSTCKCTTDTRAARQSSQSGERPPGARGPWLNTGQIRRLCPFPPHRFHVLFNSLFKVLCNFPSRYLFAIGLVVIFSLR